MISQTRGSILNWNVYYLSLFAMHHILMRELMSTRNVFVRRIEFVVENYHQDVLHASHMVRWQVPRS